MTGIRTLDSRTNGTGFWVAADHSNGHVNGEALLLIDPI